MKETGSFTLKLSVPEHLRSTAHENMNLFLARKCLEVGPASVNLKITTFPVDTLGEGQISYTQI